MTDKRKPHAQVFVISSPSGGGKTTIVQELLLRHPELVRSISVTTRRPRRGEQIGRDYQFLSPERFIGMRRKKQLLEWAKVHEAYYGTPKEPVMDALERGQSVLLSIDVQGARKVRKLLGDRSTLLFLLPPSMERLETRLMKRRTDSPTAVRLRMAAAQRELACAEWYDYSVLNDCLEDTVTAVEKIIFADSLAKGELKKHRKG